MKQFATKEMLDTWIEERFLKTDSIEDVWDMSLPDPKDIIRALKEEGYDNLDDLIADGHRYEIGGHTNNGWAYEDEVDINYIEAEGTNVEIRKRSHR